jgi:hypothetical protein
LLVHVASPPFKELKDSDEWGVTVALFLVAVKNAVTFFLEPHYQMNAGKEGYGLIL